MTTAKQDETPAWKRIAERIEKEKNDPPADALRGDRQGKSTGASVDPLYEQYQDAVPDVNLQDELPEVHRVSDAEVERILSTTPHERQYALFGKGDTPIVRGDEHNMRCPMPNHNDDHLSASFNSENGAFNCMGCEKKGDIFTVAAAHYHMNADSTDLPYIKRKLAGQLSGAPVEDYGNHEVLATPAVQEIIDLQAKKERDESKSELEEMRLRLIKNEEEPVGTDTDGTDSAAPELKAVEDYAEAVPDFDTIVPDPLPTPESTAPSTRTDVDFPLDQEPPDVDDYTKMLEPGTFLADYYAAASKDRYPNDFHFFHGLLAVGYAAGRDVVFVDDPVVYGNLYVCFMSGTGTGKSNTRDWLNAVLRKALPWDEIDPTRSGVSYLAETASGETLIDSMVGKEIPYPNQKPGEPTSTTGRVKGFLNIDELESFIKKASGSSSTLRPVLTSMYASSEVSTRSRGSGTSIATEPFLSVTANVPPESLRSLMNSGDASSGFLNRFTFVTTGLRKSQKLLNPQVDFDVDALSLKLRELLAWCQVRREVTVSPEAAELLEEFFKVEIATTAPLVDHDRDDMLVRLEVFIKKYLLLFAINEMKEVVDVPVAEKAIRLYWLTKRNLNSAGVKIKTSATSELEEHILEKVVAQFKKDAEPITAGDIMGKKCQVVRKVKSLGLESKDFDIAMRNLVATGMLVEIKPDKSDKRVKPKYIPHID